MLVSQWPTRSHQSSDSWPSRPIGCVLGTSWRRSRAIYGHITRPPKRGAGTRRHAGKDIPPLLKQAIRLDPSSIRRGYPDDDATGTRPAMS